MVDKGNSPINWKKGLELYSGDQSMLELMIEKFESLYFDSSIKKSYEAMKKGNWKALTLEMVVLIGLTNYICAEKIGEKSNNLKEILEREKSEEDENTIKEQFLSLMYEARDLKVYLAKRKDLNAKTEDIETYIKEFSPNYANEATELTNKDNTLRPEFNGIRDGDCCKCRIF